MPPRGAVVRLVPDRLAGKPQSTPRLDILARTASRDQATYDGPIWIDRLVVDGAPRAQVHRGYGAELDATIEARRAWLVQQDLGRRAADGRFEMRHSAVTQLRQREIARLGRELERETGLKHVPVPQGASVRGTVGRSIDSPDGRYIAVTIGNEVRLVPWAKPLERYRGQEISGTMGVKQLMLGRQRGMRGLDR